MSFLCILSLLFMVSTLGQCCEDIICSNIIDPVCGSADTRDGSTQSVRTYQNICYMRKKQCELNEIVDIIEVPHQFCNIAPGLPTDEESDRSLPNLEEEINARRVHDFSIVGAHQVCNHTCPTYCTDSYDPACAQIWKRNMASYSYRPMINHCHIDLFSCAAGLNVTIQPLGKCYKNPSGLLFMMQVAAMKSLKLLDDTPFAHRRANERNPKEHMWNIVERIFNKFGKQSKIEPTRE